MLSYGKEEEILRATAWYLSMNAAPCVHPRVPGQVRRHYPNMSR